MAVSNRSSTLASREARLAFWMLAPTVFIVLAVVVFPAVWNMWLSLKPVNLGDLRGPGLFRFDLSLDNYKKVAADPDFIDICLTTIIYSTAGSGLSIILGLAAALLLQGRIFGRAVLRGLFLTPYIAPVVAVTFAWSFILDPQLGVLNWLGVEQGLISQPIPFFSGRWWEIGLLGVNFKIPLALITVIMFEGWRYFPFAFLFILARLQAIPPELLHAAAVDGAGPFGRFRHIVLPQLYLVLANLFLFRFIWTFNKFDDVFLLTRGQAGTKVLTVKVYDYSFGSFDIGAGSATAMILFLILAVFLSLYFWWAAREARSFL